MRCWVLSCLVVFSLIPRPTMRGDEIKPPRDPFAFMNLAQDDRERQLCFEKLSTMDCFQLIYRHPELRETILDLAEQKCRASSDSACLDLAQYLDGYEALAFLHGVLEKPRGGNLVFLEANFGRPSVAARLARWQCLGDFASCIQGLQYPAESRDAALLETGAEWQCRLNEANSSGSTSCAILGAYSVAREWRPEKARELWTLDCERGNPTSCLLWASFGRSDEALAFARLCGLAKATGIFLGDDGRTRDEHCGDYFANGRPSLAFREAASDQLFSYAHVFVNRERLWDERVFNRSRAIGEISPYWIGKARFMYEGQAANVEFHLDAFDFNPHLGHGTEDRSRPCFSGTAFVNHRGHSRPLAPDRLCVNASDDEDGTTYVSWKGKLRDDEDDVTIRVPLPLAPEKTLQLRAPAGENPSVIEANVRWIRAEDAP